jgi:uncharacterized protein YdeI (YjbR/CyaY-like superfamily)
MPNQDPRVDAYIAKSADFAKPILRHLRELVHAACPEVEETMKWSFPNFMHKGIMCSMAAFKQHCSFGFWKSELVLGQGRGGANTDASGMGQFGRITSRSDLPKDAVMIRYLKEAKRLNEAGTKKPGRPRPKKREPLVIPGYFQAALKKNSKALAAFEEFSYSHQREYVEWITEAKTEETRQRRLGTAVEWLSQGKPRNWKYLNC